MPDDTHIKVRNRREQEGNQKKRKKKEKKRREKNKEEPHSLPTPAQVMSVNPGKRAGRSEELLPKVLKSDFFQVFL
jgi:predicted ribosome quality control (RQC) complex YloA/Tae2 family protein